MTSMRKLGLIAILLAASSAALAQPKPPNLSVVTEGTHLEVYWNPVIDADNYTLYYAPYPSADPIFRLNLDPAVTSLSGTLSAGDAFYLAVTASSSGVESAISNIEIFTLSELDPEDANASQAEAIANVARTVIVGAYADLADKATDLFDDVVTLNLNSSEENLVAAQQSWRRASGAWEQSEAFLFGPVETMGIEPMLDSWPVGLVGIESILTGSDSLTSDYISGLDGALKGFHAIEYLLFGDENDKVATDLTAREKEYLATATENLASTARTLSDAWAAGAGNHVAEFVSIDGAGLYLNEAAALQELIRGMSAIADRVSNSKISDPFSASNAELVESRFSFNTLMDLADNIRGIENIYIGRYLDQDGPGLNDLVRQNNPGLDDRIRAAITSAIEGIRGISFPFRDAVLAPGAAAQIEAAIAAVAELQVLLEGEVQSHLTGGGDSQPRFGAAMVADQDYEVSTAISPLTLPAASDGDGALTYSLSPDVPGLSFNATTRQLTGTPTMEGSYAMTYTVVDEDGDVDSLGFSITVVEAMGFAPADQASFDALAVGKRAATGDSRYYTDFTSAGRFREAEDTATYTGSYSYERTGPNMGRIVFSYDDGDSCTSTFTFDSATSGSSTFTCNDGSTGSSSWELVNIDDETMGFEPADQASFDAWAVGKRLSSGDPLYYTDFTSPGRFSEGYDTATYTGSYTYERIGQNTGSIVFSYDDGDRCTATLAFDSATSGSISFACIDGSGGTASWSLIDPPSSSQGDESFDLDPDVQYRGAVFANGRLWIVGTLGAPDNWRVHAYYTTGEPDESSGFSLDADNGDAFGIAYANGKFYVVDQGDDKVYAYNTSGSRAAASDFDLDPNVSNPVGVAFANDRFYILDVGWDRIWVHGISGQRELAADFFLRSEDVDEPNVRPSAITYANGRLHIASYNGKVYAYQTSGQRNPASDFDLHAEYESPWGIAYADGRFFVVDNARRRDGQAGPLPQKVFVYGGSTQVGMPEDTQPHFADGSGPGNQTYTVGTAIEALTLPAASGGDGALTFSLSPNVPGLSFNATTRQLTGTPTTVGAYAITYTVMDGDGDADSISFSITVGPADDAAMGFAPADQASFDALAVGKRAATGDSRYYTDFISPGRFSEVEDTATYTGSYTYERTGPNMGRIVFSYDDGDSCTSTLTFSSATSGSSTFTCNDGSTGSSSWELVEINPAEPPPTGGTDTYARLDDLTVTPGQIRFGFFTAGGCIAISSTTINGVTYSVETSKWQTRPDSSSEWSDIPGSEESGRVCSRNPAAPGQYRLVFELTIDGVTGMYASNVLVIT